MSFVLYDVETTGLAKHFDQIVHFAGVRTDADLRIIDRIQLRCRLMPHIIPSPEALHVTELGIDQLTDPSLPSHLEMVTEIHRVLQSWRPALFLGFNSLSFDEEFLRHAFYQCLQDPYLTNTQGSARADVLGLCRLTAALRPDVLQPALDEHGRTVFKLKPLAEANGLTVALAHDAMADVLTMHALCNVIRTRAPEIWSQFMRFSQKASVEAFVTDEDAFLVSEMVGNQHRTRIVTRIGQHSEQATRQYCLDLTADLDLLGRLSDDDLVVLCKSPQRPIVTVRTNAAPTLWALYDALPEHFAPFDEAEVLERVTSLREDRSFQDRLRRAAQAAQKVYPPSPHVEEQLYQDGFPPPQDKALMAQFHSAHWEQKAALARNFQDQRYRRLALRLIYFERPDLMSVDLRQTWQTELHDRLMAPVEAKSRWRSIPAARQEAERLISAGLDGEQLIRQRQFLHYLDTEARRIAMGTAA
ncbi:exonuclease domain-containing protein [Rhizobium anhuiense]|uniref:exonuclease domain-containing protein n=1 Tax=Rhizobium anhuiense TaxID=1184720 RepID=UPI0020CF3DEE|nr:exonuclease domain-containing protein [Rhizobium anhuiense]UTS88700.1 exonuclease domain-containing protein [Rhizobium anhuiense bv. trifolii]